MLIKVDEVGRFKFIDDFKLLDGTYKVTQVLSYYEAEQQSIDLYKYFYKKLKKEKKEWDKDKQKYMKYNFFKIIDVYVKEDIYFIPIPDDIEDENQILKEKPNTNIAEYSEMMLSVDLGITDSPDLMKSLILSVAEIIAYTQGIEVAPRIIPFSKKWLTDEEYDNIKKKRDIIRKRVTNYFSECHKLNDIIIKRNEKIKALENIILGQNNIIKNKEKE